MLANPHPDKPTFDLVMNGRTFIFIKLTKSDIPIYGMSNQFTLLKWENELCKVLRILKKLGQVISK